jgi:glycosyltransferase involved in cell wall biosynthesis
MDGGSTDCSVEIIKKYETQLTYWQSRPDDGHYSAVDQGMRRATGDILCWLNSDDMFHSDGLFKVASIFSKQQEIEFISGKRVGFDAEGNLLSYGHERYAWCREGLLDSRNIDKSLFVMQEATFWRRSLWERAGGGIDLSFNLAADFELWCRFSRYARLYTVDALLAGYRYYGMDQRSWRHREEYVAQCLAIIERERDIPSTIPAFDSDVPPLLQVDSACFIEVIVKKSLPSISIVTPSFNQAPFLEECIDSVLSQNYPCLEYIIMDGGSSDNSVEIIKKYEKHLTYWQSKPDGGQYNAVNEGFKKTSGDIMAWLNSDDKYHRDAFFKVAYLLDSSFGIEWLTGHPTFWGKHGEFSHIEPELPTYCRKDFLEGRYNYPFIQQESTFWKRSLWDRAGGCLRTDLDYAGDLELWLRFFRYALLYSVNTFLGGYRSHGDQKAMLHMDRYVAEAEMVIENELKLHSELYSSMSPDAPTPLELEIQGYKAYLSRQGSHNGSPELMAATEDAFQYLLRMSSSNNATADLKDKLQLEVNKVMGQLEAIQSSLSWSITKPLRWLGDFVRRMS